MPFSPGSKALSLYALVGAKIYMQKVIQRQHWGDAWCFRSQHPAPWCWAPTSKHCAGGGYGQAHPPCALLRLTLSAEPLWVANRETLRTGTDFNSVLNGQHVVVQSYRMAPPPLQPKLLACRKAAIITTQSRGVQPCFAKMTSGQSTVKWLTAAHLGPSKLGEMALPDFFGKLPNQPVPGTFLPTCSDALCHRTDYVRQRENKWRFIHYV